MNFLGHALISLTLDEAQQRHTLYGNFAGDFYKGPLADLALPTALRELVTGELAGREFMPVIERILSVSSYATPSFWQVITDRGETALTLKGEENIRRLPGNALLIADSHGINYLIRDRLALDAQSRKFLDRFL